MLTFDVDAILWFDIVKDEVFQTRMSIEISQPYMSVAGSEKLRHSAILGGLVFQMWNSQIDLLQGQEVCEAAMKEAPNSVSTDAAMYCQHQVKFSQSSHLPY